jgi:hypothetical protein
MQHISKLLPDVQNFSVDNTPSISLIGIPAGSGGKQGHHKWLSLLSTYAMRVVDYLQVRSPVVRG